MNAYIEVWSPELWDTVQAGLEDEGNASRWPNLGN